MAGSLQPLQGIASNGKEITFIFGNARLGKKAIYKYDILGNFKSADFNFNVGIKDALFNSNDNFYEPEGISYYENNLKVLITYGKDKNKKNVIYDYPEVKH